MLSCFRRPYRDRRGSSLTFVICCFALIAYSLPTQADDRRPNILLILADDLGFSDLGCYGSEIATPNLDRLADGGLRFTQFYNTARCWPTRGALMTGYYAQQIRRDSVPDIPSGGRGQRPIWAPLLSELLQPLGYHSYHSGKWHIDNTPLMCGFERSYSLNDHGRYFHPKAHTLDDKPLPPVEPGSGFYTTTAIASYAIEFLEQHAQNHPGEPFFQYLAFTSPHFPLHALPEDIAKYRDRYREGWEKVRRERWSRQQKMGLLNGTLSEAEQEIGPPYDFPDAMKVLGPGEVNRPLPWDQLTDEQKEFQATKMAIHAAMVDRMDQEIGRVLKQLQTMNALDDTIILFLSDNGASAEIMVRDDGHDPSAAPGSAASHLCLGPGWSTCSNTPFRRHKTWVHEGGISTPLIVHWPSGLKAKGEYRRSVGHVIDIVPTLVEIAGGSLPATWDGVEVPEHPGMSLAGAFQKDDPKVTRTLWWLHEGNRALRVGDWKVVAARDEPWELYNLATDRTETTNLADKVSYRLNVLTQNWEIITRSNFLLAKSASLDDIAPRKPKKQSAEP